MKKRVFEAGQKFTCRGRVFTAKSFFGPDGIEYKTAKECRKHHRKGMICVMNEEFDGATDMAKSYLITE